MPMGLSWAFKGQWTNCKFFPHIPQNLNVHLLLLLNDIKITGALHILRLLNPKVDKKESISFLILHAFQYRICCMHVKSMHNDHQLYCICSKLFEFLCYKFIVQFTTRMYGWVYHTSFCDKATSNLSYEEYVFTFIMGLTNMRVLGWYWSELQKEIWKKNDHVELKKYIIDENIWK